MYLYSSNFHLSLEAGADKRASGRSQVARRCSVVCHMGREQTLIKVCGVGSRHDAELAASSGADYVGMILWPKARRSVSIETALQISGAAKKHGARPVGVFVDEGFSEIVRTCEAANITTAQLHGKGARASMPDLPDWLEVIYVMHASPDGSLNVEDQEYDPPGSSSSRRPDWVLLDGLRGGSGQTYDWSKIEKPVLEAGIQGWLLAGGLSPDNVGQAISLAQPCGVDVSSGVSGPDGLAKDPDKIRKFIDEVRQASKQA